MTWYMTATAAFWVTVCSPPFPDEHEDDCDPVAVPGVELPPSCLRMLCVTCAARVPVATARAVGVRLLLCRERRWVAEDRREVDRLPGSRLGRTW